MESPLEDNMARPIRRRQLLHKQACRTQPQMGESAVMAKARMNNDTAMTDDVYLKEGSMPALNEKLTWK